GVAAALVHRIEPHAEGSGIPRVEAVADGRVRPDRFRILPVKYIGGLLAIGSGMALGREGPSVQMGGTAAVIVATITRRNLADLRLLVAGGAAAGPRPGAGGPPREAPPPATGALVGLLVWAAPDLAGSGGNLTQNALLGRGALLAITGVLVLRFVLGPVCYPAPTPGGLFAPMLVL